MVSWLIWELTACPREGMDGILGWLPWRPVINLKELNLSPEARVAPLAFDRGPAVDDLEYLVKDAILGLSWVGGAAEYLVREEACYCWGVTFVRSLLSSLGRSWNLGYVAKSVPSE